MRFGLFGINTGVCARPETATAVARAAEAAGFDSVWTGEHVVLPDPQAPPSPAPPQTPMLDPTAALAFLAAHTERLLLGTGIIILPQRNPLVLAKELASVDVLSDGRLLFGVGVGYLEPEFRALGIPFERRGARVDEYLDAIVALWTQKNPSYDGEFVSFSGIDAQPRPIRRPHPPIVIGGASRAAFRRAITRGNAWYGFAMDLDTTRRCIGALREAAQQNERPAELGELEINITPTVSLDDDAVGAFAELGVHRLIPFQLARSGDEMVDAVRKLGDVVRANA